MTLVKKQIVAVLFASFLLIYGVIGLPAAYFSSASHPMAYIVPGFAIVIVVVSLVSFVRGRGSGR